MQASGIAASPLLSKTPLHTAAQEFEAIFLRMLLDTSRVFDEEDSLLGSSSASRQWRQLMNSELADCAAGTGSSIGIAETLIRQLIENNPQGCPP